MECSRRDSPCARSQTAFQTILATHSQTTKRRDKRGSCMRTTRADVFKAGLIADACSNRPSGVGRLQRQFTFGASCTANITFNKQPAVPSCDSIACVRPAALGHISGRNREVAEKKNVQRVVRLFETEKAKRIACELHASRAESIYCTCTQIAVQSTSNKPDSSMMSTRRLRAHRPVRRSHHHPTCPSSNSPHPHSIACLECPAESDSCARTYRKPALPRSRASGRRRKQSHGQIAPCASVPTPHCTLARLSPPAALSRLASPCLASDLDEHLVQLLEQFGVLRLVQRRHVRQRRRKTAQTKLQQGERREGESEGEKQGNEWRRGEQRVAWGRVRWAAVAVRTVRGWNGRPLARR